ncbi:MAG: transporter associated domain-containing protein [Candidatus Endonucleobacter bathymodioli]|uniref:Magnesium and cobalt efflux protein CorC n=1 Tax=Candidatus Endonucleibacter bathymodioli TaxID=539814 RepID=A0AA90SDR0_9GAMM|nr:transporter associated domain-containing protein [Candidatus Endonucleobacter bathymodioli]
MNGNNLLNDNDSVDDKPSVTWIERVSRIFRKTPHNLNDALALLRDASTKGIINEEALSIIEGAIQVADMQVREIMIPRSQMVCVEENKEPKEFLPKIIEYAHSRFPVIVDTKDEVIGVLIAKDLLPLIIENSKVNIKDLIRPATFIPESKRLNVLLREFRVNRNHMAIVVDEFGGVAGLITIEDILEQIVGDIEDEHDIEEEHFIRPLNATDNTFIVKALTPIDEFNNHFKTHFSADEFDTIGGIIMQKFGHMPKRHDSITLSSFRFDILNADSRRIRLLQVSPGQ